MKIVNLTRNTLLAEDAQIARNFFSRAKGLLGRKSLESGKALVIRPCNSVHSFFMQFSIDVIFLNRQNKVIGLLTSFSPSRLSPIYFSAHQAIELPSGVIPATSTQLGDFIAF